MADRDPRGLDPDDWFAEPGRAASRRARQAPGAGASPDEDDWIGSPRPRRESLAGSLPEGWAPIAVAIVLVAVLLIGGLALAGVFSGSKPKPAVATLPYSAPTATVPAPPTTAPSTVVGPATTLKPGDTGAQVKALQRALASLGYSVGKIDGDYGAATTTALKQFQTAKKMTADGIFGPATKTALGIALAGG